jgi:hypothetical protein
MLHPPRLETGPLVAAGPRRLPAVLHNAYEAPDGSQAAVLANWTTSPQHVKLTWKNRSSSIDLRPSEVRLVKPGGE